MINVQGDIRYRLSFTYKIDMTEEEWDALSVRKQNELLDDLVVNSGDLRNLEVMDVEVDDVWTDK